MAHKPPNDVDLTPSDVKAMSSRTTPVVPAETNPERLKDVWSRSGSKYRWRAFGLLALNVVLFAGVGSFAFWLRRGLRFAPAQPGYWDELIGAFSTIGIAGESGVSLGSLLLEPISVQDVPMQIPILGLLMAALISIPILVAILYRFWSSLPFVGVVGFLAVMPWLALTLLVSCILASGRPFRTRFRFMSALLGLTPTVIYLILAWAGTTDAIVGKIDPVDRIKFVAPWMLAIVASTVVFALVLLVARLVDYRPGAIAPLLAVMFGLPLALFEYNVGRDELYYRLLKANSAHHFADIDASLPLEQAVAAAWARQPTPRKSKKAIREAMEIQWLFELASDPGPARSAMAEHRAALVAQCDDFIKYFPQSRYVMNVLYVKARALDMRVDPRAFRESRWIRFYDGFPSPASRASWRTIADQAPETKVGAVAMLRMAQLEARDGDVERAIARLETLRKRFAEQRRPALGPMDSEKTIAGMLSRASPESAVEIGYERVLLDAHQLLNLLSSNRDPLYGYEPIGGPRRPADTFSFGLLDLNPRDHRYVDNLRALKDRYVNCQIEDNIELEIAKATVNPLDKIEILEAGLRKYESRDAVPEAIYRLGVAYKDQGDPDKSRRAFIRLFQEFPENVWTRQAVLFAPWAKLGSSDGADG